MSRFSVIHRLYLGFGFICAVIVVWGCLNIWMMGGISHRIAGITGQAYPIQQAASDITIVSQRLGREVLSLTELKTPEAVNRRYGHVQNAIKSVREKIDTLSEQVAGIAGAASLQNNISALRDQLKSLAELAAASRTLRNESLAVSSQVLDGLSDFLIQAAEMKQEMTREAQGVAANDIYVADLLVTLMDRFSSVELLVMNLVNTQDPKALAQKVEQIRFNSKNFKEDIADLVTEIPTLSSLSAQRDAFLKNINSDDGIVNRYYDYRQTLLKVETVRGQVSGLIDSVDKGMAGIRQFSESYILDAGQALDGAATRSTNLVYLLLPVVILVALAVSFALGRIISRPLRAAVNQVVAMADGDYREQLDVTASGEFAVLISSINRLVSAMQAILRDLRAAADELANVSNSNQEASVQVRERMGHQNQELASIATAMVEMETAIHDVSGNTGRSLELTESIDRDLGQSRQLMERNLGKVARLDQQVGVTSDIVDKLAASSNDISTIIQTIEEIAGRTNLLALNAAIEAARAGESGRGFAVVADEVRELASRTTKSTDDIRALIGRLQEDSRQAVAEMEQSRAQLKDSQGLIQETSGEINSIGDAMVEIRSTADQVRHAMQEQESVAGAVTRNVNDISVSSQDNFSQIEALADNGKRLQSMMEKIERLVGNFRV